ALPAHDLGLGILHIAELERARRTRLRAGRHDVAVTQRLAGEPALVLRTADPLHAEGALLHHAASPDRDLRIELQVERLRPRELVVLEPVVVANLERAVVAAVARADAAVVYLAVESVGSVIRGEHRADGLTRRVVTVLAHHRDRKSTRLNSSHVKISYAVFCLK